MDKAELVERMALVSDNKATEVAQPGEEGLDPPPAPKVAQWTPILGRREVETTPMGPHDRDAQPWEHIIQRVGIVGAIPDDPLGQVVREAEVEHRRSKGHLVTPISGAAYRPSMRRRLVVFCILLLTGAISACATPLPPTPMPTLTAPAPAPTATSAPLPDLPRLPLPTAEAVYASPDGTRLAALDPNSTTLTLYDLAGTSYGHYRDPAGRRLAVWWLADSSGVVIAADDSGASGGAPTQLMDRSGTVHPTAFDSISGPLLSPGGQWIAGTHVSSTGTQDVAEIAPRSGAPVRRLAPGSDFLGWLDGELAYVANGTIYLVPPTGGAGRVIARVPSESTLREASAAATGESAAVSSPDDQVLIVQVHDYLQMLTSTGVAKLPIHVIPFFWAGPHAALGSTGPTGAVSVIDMLTGATIQNSSARLGQNSPQALSGDWIAASALYERPIQLLAINYQTGASLGLGWLPTGMTITPLGQHGRFLLRDADGVMYVAQA